MTQKQGIVIQLFCSVLLVRNLQVSFTKLQADIAVPRTVVFASQVFFSFLLRKQDVLIWNECF